MKNTHRPYITVAILDFLTGMFAKLLTMLSPNGAYTGIPDDSLPPWTGEPTILDVLAVKRMLANIRVHPLPTELIDIIIDHAEYWPHTTSFPHPSCRVHQDGNKLVTRSMPLGYPDESVPIRYPLRAEDYESGAQSFFPPKEFMEKNYEETTPRILGAWKESSMPDTKLEFPCRKIVFTIRSHDQGWGGEHHYKGTFQGSFTWFDIGLQKLQGVDILRIPKSVLKAKPKRAEPEEDQDDYSSEDERTTQEESFLQFHNKGTTNGALDGWNGLRFDLQQVSPALKVESPNDEGWRRGPIDHPYLPHSHTLQKNRTTTGEFEEHEIVLSWKDRVDPESEFAIEVVEGKMGSGKEVLNGELVRNLRVGDVVTVWARARFPGWMNVVDKVEIKVYWAV